MVHGGRSRDGITSVGGVVYTSMSVCKVSRRKVRSIQHNSIPHVQACHAMPALLEFPNLSLLCISLGTKIPHIKSDEKQSRKTRKRMRVVNNSESLEDLEYGRLQCGDVDELQSASLVVVLATTTLLTHRPDPLLASSICR